MKVLIAESDIDQREQIEQLCDRLGYLHTSVDSVEDGNKAIDGHHYDLLYTAHYLKDATGFDLIRSLRMLNKGMHTPIVMTTESSHQSFLEKAFATGVSETFGKHQLPELEAYFTRIGDHFQKISGRVLLVEDSPSQQQMIKAILTQQGLKVECASNVAAAWHLFNSQSFDLVICDIVLEGAESGLGLLSRIRRSPEAEGETPVIVISSYDTQQRRSELFRLGADDYINKPIITDELISRSRRLIKSASLRRDLQNAHMDMSQFLSRMTHECRNSINIVNGMCELMLRKGELNPTQQTQLQMILKASTHQLELVNDILDYSKLKNNATDVELSLCPLKPMLAETLELFRYKAEESQLKLSLTVDEQLPDILLLDEHKVRQILLNLLGNAVKFTESGEVSLGARSEANRLILTVADTGPGISEAEQQLLFRAFRQTKLGAKSRGSGLGLAISTELATLMGGTLSVHSVPQQGSAFTLALPLQTAAANN